MSIFVYCLFVIVFCHCIIFVFLVVFIVYIDIIRISKNLNNNNLFKKWKLTEATFKKTNSDKDNALLDIALGETLNT